jgi:hypothetical protein
VGDRQARAPYGPENFELEIRAPHIVVDFEERTAHRSAGVIDENVEPAKTIDHRFHEAFDIARLTHVSGDRKALNAAFLYFGGDLVEELLAPSTNRNVSAFLRETQGGRFSDTFGSSGHDGHFSFQSEFHVYLLVSVPVGSAPLQTGIPLAAAILLRKVRRSPIEVRSGAD